MDPISPPAALQIAFVADDSLGAAMTEKLRAIRANGPVPLSPDQRLLLERAYAILREYCFYYGALLPAFGSGLVSVTARQALLGCMRGLYVELDEIGVSVFFLKNHTLRNLRKEALAYAARITLLCSCFSRSPCPDRI